MMARASKKIGAKTITLVQGDITHQEIDVIANAANSALSGGGGVDGAIHRAAGPDLLKACRNHKRCPTGSAVLTPAFNLKAKYVAHAVGPVWSGGANGEPELLASAYKTCLELANQEQCKAIALPSISTGIYGFPVNKAAPIALNTVKEHLSEETSLEEVVFVLFDSRTFKVFEKELGNL